MVNNIKKYTVQILIAILVLIILLQRSCDPVMEPQEPTVITKYDTIWKKTHDTIIKEVKVISIKWLKPDGPLYTPGENIDTCQARFNHLLKQHTAFRVYKDTIKIDSIGSVVVIDTIWLNKLKERAYITNFKIPIVTKTVTITKQTEPKRQMYIGANIFGDKTQLQLFSPGILYKTKKDHIYQANIGINFDGSFNYGVGMYYKIKLK